MSFLESSLKQGGLNSNTTNAVGHTNMVEGLVRAADRDLQDYHKLVELFRQDLEAMKSKVINNNDEILDTIRPLVESLFRSLELGMVNQKQENNNFQEQITELRKQKAVLAQMIVATSKKSGKISDQVGNY